MNLANHPETSSATTPVPSVSLHPGGTAVPESLASLSILGPVLLEQGVCSPGRRPPLFAQ